LLVALAWLPYCSCADELKLSGHITIWRVMDDYAEPRVEDSPKLRWDNMDHKEQDEWEEKCKETYKNLKIRRYQLNKDYDTVERLKFTFEPETQHGRMNFTVNGKYFAGHNPEQSNTIIVGARFRMDGGLSIDLPVYNTRWFHYNKKKDTRITFIVNPENGLENSKLEDLRVFVPTSYATDKWNAYECWAIQDFDFTVSNKKRSYHLKAKAKQNFI